MARRCGVSTPVACHHVDQDVNGAPGAPQQPGVDPVQPPYTLLNCCKLAGNPTQLQRGGTIEQLSEGGIVRSVRLESRSPHDLAPQHPQFVVEEADLGAQTLLIRNVLAGRLEVHTDKRLPTVMQLLRHQAQAGEAPLQELDVHPGF